MGTYLSYKKVTTSIQMILRGSWLTISLLLNDVLEDLFELGCLPMVLTTSASLSSSIIFSSLVVTCGISSKPNMSSFSSSCRVKLSSHLRIGRPWVLILFKYLVVFHKGASSSVTSLSYFSQFNFWWRIWFYFWAAHITYLAFLSPWIGFAVIFVSFPFFLYQVLNIFDAIQSWNF